MLYTFALSVAQCPVVFVPVFILLQRFNKLLLLLGYYYETSTKFKLNVKAVTILEKSKTATIQLLWP